MDGVTGKSNRPVSRSQWNPSVKVRVIVWHGNKGFRMFDFANAGYQVSWALSLPL